MGSDSLLKTQHFVGEKQAVNISALEACNLRKSWRESDRDGETDTDREDTLTSLSTSVWAVSDKGMSIYI